MHRYTHLQLHNEAIKLLPYNKYSLLSPFDKEVIYKKFQRLLYNCSVAITPLLPNVKVFKVNLSIVCNFFNCCKITCSLEGIKLKFNVDLFQRLYYSFIHKSAKSNFTAEKKSFHVHQFFRQGWTQVFDILCR